MSESKHQPLRVRDADPSVGERGTITNPAAFAVEGPGGDLRAIITMSAVTSRCGEEARAFAFQCKAAPQMLEALRELLKEYPDCGCTADAPDSPGQVCGACMARAAIAAATGGEP